MNGCPNSTRSWKYQEPSRDYYVTPLPVRKDFHASIFPSDHIVWRTFFVAQVLTLLSEDFIAETPIYNTLAEKKLNIEAGDSNHSQFFKTKRKARLTSRRPNGPPGSQRPWGPQLPKTPTTRSGKNKGNSKLHDGKRFQ
ncbi:hypothetical protein AVEN_252928-1 [Araneus ventricosus]|uniref:Uncharacterized protein n=1 Tax=Araneus ventricosus TaxID=182803 RepID=A0A4Y2FBP6_ARAVE|nr:hypothetical protein AVEN_252928-1 [Araneus ventricosus]